jgi:hypothetical protein
MHLAPPPGCATIRSAIDLSGGLAMTSTQAVQSLQAAIRGTLVQPADAGYDSARKVYNAMIDRRPRHIARCVDTADVIAALQFAR